MSGTAPLLGSHPLDECDPEECYHIMMAERTVLIAGRREAEDNLVKTVIQLSVALVVLLGGFLSQAKIVVSETTAVVLSGTLVLLGLTVIGGLAEHFISSKAYSQQQDQLEKYYTKKIKEFSEPPANRWVRTTHVAILSTFVLAVLALCWIAATQSWERVSERSNTPASTSATSASTSASATSASATPSATSASPTPATSGKAE